MRWLILAFAAMLSACGPSNEAKVAAPQPGEGVEYVTDADPLTPDEQLKTFKLPPGFKIELFAAEPDIGKPINIAFDAKGRLWMTTSSEYPIPAEGRAGQDRITIAEDTDDDGRADKFTHFAENLNIPQGIIPVKDGAIAFSIPNLYYFADKNGDGRADSQKLLVGPFATGDTHAVTSNLARDFDGSILGFFGISNPSTMRGVDGSQASLPHGGSFRFEEDGTNVRAHAYGRVNPFGTAFDRFGYVYSTDSHTWPITQLIDGGEYSGFATPHTGLGFAPAMMDYLHGPTAIAGIALYEAEGFPAEYRGDAFVGNVVSNRVKRDKISFTGSTPKATPQPDFLVSDDPWFRPVNIKLGPDGALYVADFYNGVIAHVEVPPDHPKRDKMRGRIWRITYVGDGAAKTPGPSARDFTTLSADALMEAIGDPNMTVRELATNQIVERIGKSAAPKLIEISKNFPNNANQRVHAMWALERMGALPDTQLLVLASDPEWLVRLHANRLIGGRDRLSPALAAHVRRQLGDADPRMRREAIAAMGRHPEAADIAGTLAALKTTSEADTHLHYVIRLSLRSQMQTDAGIDKALATEWTPEESRSLADIMVAVRSQKAAEYLWRHVQAVPESATRVSAYAAHVARYGPARLSDDLAAFTQKRFADNPNAQLSLYSALEEGARSTGRPLSAKVRAWGATSAQSVLAALPEAEEQAWTHTTIRDLWPTLSGSWLTQEWSPAGEEPIPVVASGAWTYGKLISPTFAAPEQLSFRLFATKGQGRDPVNYARLVLVETGKEIARASVTDDPDQTVSWRLRRHRGKPVRLEVVDAAPDDNVQAFEIVAIGGIEPAGVLSLPKAAPPELGPQLGYAMGVLSREKPAGAAAMLSSVLEKPWLDKLMPDLIVESFGFSQYEGGSPRLAAARALVAIEGASAGAKLAQTYRGLTQNDALREDLAGVLASTNEPEALRTLAAALPTEGAAMLSVARALASSERGRDSLLTVAEKGEIQGLLMQDPEIGALMRRASASQRTRFDALLAALPPPDEALQATIDRKLGAVVELNADMENGARVFTANCASCHQLDGVGGITGPQLDGIGRWGKARLVEAIVAPSRAVNGEFRTYELELKDGRYEIAIFRGEDGQVMRFVGAGGEPFSVAKSDIVSQTPSQQSLMPAGFGDAIEDDDFSDLVAYLLTKQ